MGQARPVGATLQGDGPPTARLRSLAFTSREKKRTPSRTRNRGLAGSPGGCQFQAEKSGAGPRRSGRPSRSPGPAFSWGEAASGQGLLRSVRLTRPSPPPAPCSIGQAPGPDRGDNRSLCEVSLETRLLAPGKRRKGRRDRKCGRTWRLVREIKSKPCPGALEGTAPPSLRPSAPGPQWKTRLNHCSSNCDLLRSGEGFYCGTLLCVRVSDSFS